MSVFGSAANFAGLFQNAPSYTTLQNVKDPWYQSFLTGAGNDLTAARGTQASALKDYITKYLSGEGAAKARSGQEIGNIDRYFNGDVQRDLAGQRAARGLAVTNAADLAQRYALANQNRSLVGNEGGGSSYDRRLAFRNMGDIQTAAALDAANQAHNDYGYLENARLGLTGRRQQMANDLAGYGLVPENVRMQLLAQQFGLGSGIGNARLANSFWGLQQNKDGLDKAIDFLNNQQTLMNQDVSTGISALSAFRGGGGGGAAQPGLGQSQMQAYNSGFGPVSSGFGNTQSANTNAFINQYPYAYGGGNPYGPAPMPYSSWPSASGF